MYICTYVCMYIIESEVRFVHNFDPKYFFIDQTQKHLSQNRAAHNKQEKGYYDGHGRGQPNAVYAVKSNTCTKQKKCEQIVIIDNDDADSIDQRHTVEENFAEQSSIRKGHVHALSGRHAHLQHLGDLSTATEGQLLRIDRIYIYMNACHSVPLPLRENCISISLTLSSW